MEVFLHKELKAAGFDPEIIHDQVLVVNNFLLDKELDVMNNIIKETPEETWGVEYRKNLVEFCMQKFGRDDVDNLVAEGKYEITQGWHDKNLDIQRTPASIAARERLDKLVRSADPSLEFGGFGTMQRMQPGVELKSHTDQHTDPSIRYAAIIYINDDYNDGTLFFKNIKDSDIKPKPGSLLLFPGNEEFEHGVRHVGEGNIRYVLVGFIRVKDFYENNKY